MDTVELLLRVLPRQVVVILVMLVKPLFWLVVGLGNYVSVSVVLIYIASTSPERHFNDTEIVMYSLGAAPFFSIFSTLAMLTIGIFVPIAVQSVLGAFIQHYRTIDSAIPLQVHRKEK